MNDKIKKVFSVEKLIVALGIFVILLVINNVLRTIYLPFLSENIRLKIVATAEADEKAMGNNVRIGSIAVNGRNINLGKLEPQSQSNWEYESSHDMWYVYDLKTREELVIDIKNVHSLGITFIEEVGSGCVEVYINDKLWIEDNLYADASWQKEKHEYLTSVWVFPEANIGMLFLCFCCSYILAILILMLERKTEDICNRARDIVIHWILAGITVLSSIFIQYQILTNAQEYIKNQAQPVLKAMVLMFLLIELLYFIFGKTWISFICVAMLNVVSGIVSNVKLENRGVPLLPWDFTMMFEALSVAENYDISMTLTDFGIIILVFGLTVMIFCIKTEKRQYQKWYFRIIAAVVVLFCTVGYVQKGFIKYSATESRVYQVSNYYKNRGFINAFLEYMAYMNPAEKPENYDKDTMLAISDDIHANIEMGGNQEKKTPNIIAIMSESFWDVSKINTVSVEEELLPEFEKLKSESMYGNLFSHVFGGSTVVSEFEFLTGFSGEFFPTDYMIYGNYLEDGFRSAVSILEEQGYQTMAFHPFEATNYNRENAYEKFGFDDSFYEDDFNDVKVVRNYISDESLFEKIIENYEAAQDESEKPLFVFAVTMQNHGGYWENSIYEEGRVNFKADTYNDVTQNSIADYLAGLHESDRALGELVNYFREEEEDTIIIYFGDHTSDAGSKDDKMLESTSWAEDSLQYHYETHVVPFIVWSNYNNQSKDAGIMEIGQLLPTVFQEYGIEGDAFWLFLLEMKEHYSATSKTMLVKDEAEYYKLSEMTEEQKKYYECYKMLQYDYIWGEKYSELWSNSN